MTKSNGVYRGGICSVLLGVCIGAAASAAVWRYAPFTALPPSTIDSIMRAFGNTLAQLSLTMAGFILTSTAIFTAFGDKPLIQNMYKSGHAKNLIFHMYLAIGFNLLACVGGIATSIAPTPSLYVLHVLIGLAVMCLYSIATVMRKLWYVLTFIHGAQHRAKDIEDVDHSAKPIGRIG